MTKKLPILVTFGDEVMRIQKYYAIFVYILHARWVLKTEKKNGKKITQKSDQNKKPKDEFMG